MDINLLKSTLFLTPCYLGFCLLFWDGPEDNRMALNLENPQARTGKSSIIDTLGSESLAGLIVKHNLIFEETFEGNNPLDLVRRQFAEKHSFQTVTAPVFNGEKSGKFELRYGDKRATKNGLRSEILFPTQDHNERWYSFAVYFPSEGYQKDTDSSTELVSQWHQPGLGTPSASLRIRNDKLYFRVGNDNRKGPSHLDHFHLGNVPKDCWQEFVFHFVHSNGPDGLIEIWQNGKQVVNRKGGNMYSGASPSWKIGIYKAVWANRATEVALRIVYFDNIRMGNENASFGEMVTEFQN